MTRAALLATSFAALILLAGCGGPAGPTASPTPTTTATKTATPTPTPTPTAVPLSAPCTRDNLTITYGVADASAGHAHGVLTFVNSSGTACSMTGYPVVVFSNPEAAQPMGALATSDSSSPSTGVELAPGQSATAAVTVTQAGDVDGCDVVTAKALIVAPPLDHTFDWSSDGRNVPVDLDACNNDDIGLITVGAVTP
ncbi:MAG: hypothetical protein BGO97_11960 [Micrococcales bacterium 70-64]|nr:DUF4232 domain-containing protein [Leifsonia sp.]ODU64677.1 MAG: hypothetical protein ABT06_11960 [Leifsonia sp. SCN 70-46]OJX86368.1 MAG: hypothetical protein BGO97_11960 [Micrococcales bacterium 70-64]